MVGALVFSSATGISPVVSQQLSLSLVNSFRVAAVADRLITHMLPGRDRNPNEFVSLCLSLARGIDYAVANNEVPAKAQDLPILLKQVCQCRNDTFVGAAVMVLMVSVKSACKIGWFSDQERQELYTLANEIGSNFLCPKDVDHLTSNSLLIITTVMSKFYPLLKMGQILTASEVKPGYGAYVLDFHISKCTTHSPNEKIRLFVAQTDNTDTSACIISPQKVNFLVNGKAVERRTNILMDTGPQMPTNVTPMLKFGTNLIQAVGQFSGACIIAVAFMSPLQLPENTMLRDHVPSVSTMKDLDSDVIEGPSRVSLNCPISYTRIRNPIKGISCKHLQCFDFGNFMSINWRRPSWRCPHCNQYVSYTDIRIDQNMLKVLREVGKNVSNVLISADGSWKAILESDATIDEIVETSSANLKERSEMKDSSSSSTMCVTVDLTADDDDDDDGGGVENMILSDMEDVKPLLPSTAQNPVTHVEDDFWSSVYFNAISAVQLGSSSSSATISRPCVSNILLAPIITDAVSPALTRNNSSYGQTNLVSGLQDPFLPPSNFQVPQSLGINSIDGFGRSLQTSRPIYRHPVAVPAPPPTSQVPIAQQRTAVNTVVSNGFSHDSQNLPSMTGTAANGAVSFSSANPLWAWDMSSLLLQHSASQNWSQELPQMPPPVETFAHQQVVPPPASSTQLPSSDRLPPGLTSNSSQLQSLRATQAHSSASANLLRSHLQRNVAPIGLANHAPTTTTNTQQHPLPRAHTLQQTGAASNPITTSITATNCQQTLPHSRMQHQGGIGIAHPAGSNCQQLPPQIRMQQQQQAGASSNPTSTNGQQCRPQAFFKHHQHPGHLLQQQQQLQKLQQLLLLQQQQQQQQQQRQQQQQQQHQQQQQQQQQQHQQQRQQQRQQQQHQQQRQQQPQVGSGSNTAANENNRAWQLAAAQRAAAAAAARQPPSLPVHIQTGRTGNGIRAQTGTSQSAIAGELDSVTEQNWQPTGRMRGSLSGQAYVDALREFMVVQSSKTTQPPPIRCPPLNIPSCPTIPPHLQALLATNRLRPTGPSGRI